MLKVSQDDCLRAFSDACWSTWFGRCLHNPWTLHEKTFWLQGPRLRPRGLCGVRKCLRSWVFRSSWSMENGERPLVTAPNPCAMVIIFVNMCMSAYCIPWVSCPVWFCPVIPYLHMEPAKLAQHGRTSWGIRLVLAHCDCDALRFWGYLPESGELRLAQNVSPKMRSGPYRALFFSHLTMCWFVRPCCCDFHGLCWGFPWTGLMIVFSLKRTSAHSFLLLKDYLRSFRYCIWKLSALPLAWRWFVSLFLQWKRTQWFVLEIGCHFWRYVCGCNAFCDEIGSKLVFGVETPSIMIGIQESTSDCRCDGTVPSVWKPWKWRRLQTNLAQKAGRGFCKIKPSVNSDAQRIDQQTSPMKFAKAPTNNTIAHGCPPQAWKYTGDMSPVLSFPRAVSTLYLSTEKRQLWVDPWTRIVLVKWTS